MPFFVPWILTPDYILRDIELHLFVRRDLSDLDDEETLASLRKVNHIGRKELRLDSGAIR